MLFADELIDERLRRKVFFDFDRLDEAVRMRDELVVEHELLQAETVHVIEHAWTRDRVDARERGKHRAHAGLGARLRVVALRVRERHIGLTRKLQVLRDLRVTAIDLKRFDGGHRVRHELHVEARGRPSEENGRTRANALGDGNAAHHFGGMEYERAYGRCRRDHPEKQHGHDLDRDPPLGAINDVGDRVFTPAKRRVGTARENR